MQIIYKQINLTKNETQKGVTISGQGEPGRNANEKVSTLLELSDWSLNMRCSSVSYPRILFFFLASGESYG